MHFCRRRSHPSKLTRGGDLDDSNFYGVVRTSQAFASVIVQNGGGAILNVLSDVTWYARQRNSVYATSKSAAWSYSNSLRSSLRDKDVQVLSLHIGFMDTDMVRGFDILKSDPRTVADATLDALENGDDEIAADEQARLAQRGLSMEPAYYLDRPPLAYP